jgi:hypothetical protein
MGIEGESIMALRGPEPKDHKIGRTPNAEWIEVIDEPNLDAPDLIGEHHPSTMMWWTEIRSLPHTVLWREADWTFAVDTALIKDRFYEGDFTAAITMEMRRREDLMGTTMEARRKLRIRYIHPIVSDEEIHEVFQGDIESRRRRLLEE